MPISIMKKHLDYMRQALKLAESSPRLPTNYRVGALLVNEETGVVLASGYTLELPGNTHAEQCCLMKLASQHQVPTEEDDDVGRFLPNGTVLYTTVEPCVKRLSGNKSCVNRILSTTRESGQPAIQKVFVGIKEPEKFVGQNEGRQELDNAGIEVVHVPGLEDEILTVATAGHSSEGTTAPSTSQ